MEDTLISFETAKLAKEKGFEEGVLHHYRDGLNFDRELVYGGSLYNMNSSEEQLLWEPDLFSAPTQSLLQKWLREEHGINISIVTGYKDDKNIYECWIMYNGSKEIEPELSNYIEEKFGSTWYELTYEEALEKGLQEALKLIKQNK